MSAGDFVESRPPKPDEYIKVTHSSSSKILFYQMHIQLHIWIFTEYIFPFCQFMDWYASQPHPRKVSRP